jgi:predicted MFS family arabinose efflux permease
MAAGVTGAAISLLGPAQMAYMGHLVPREAVGNATALLQVSLSITRVLGPLIVAGLVAIDAIGPAGAFFLIAALLSAALVPLVALPRAQSGAAVVESILGEVMLGVRHVLDQPALLRILVTFIAVTLLGFSYFVVLPRFADNVLGAGDSGYGIIVGISSAGGLLANLVLAPLADSRRVSLLLTISVFAFGGGLLATGAAPTFALALVTMIVVGASASAFQVLSSAAALRASEAVYFGRVTALMNIAWSLTNLVGLPVGFVADAVGERATLAGVGGGLVALSMLLALWMTVPGSRLRRVEAEVSS